MPLIGNRKTAIAALEAYRANTYHDDPWSRLGRGSIRTALLHRPTDVVYKIEHNRRWTEFSSAVEVKNTQRLLRMCYPDQWWSTRVRIPLASMFTIDGQSVAAMQYVKGEHKYDSIPDWVSTELDSVGLADMHWMNYVIDSEGTVWPVDLGSDWTDNRDYLY